MRTKYDDNKKQKRSRSKYMMTKDGVPCVTGWCPNQYTGGISVVAVPKNNPQKLQDGSYELLEDTQASGKRWEKWVCKLSFGNPALPDRTETGFFTPDDGKLRIPSMNLVANTRLSNGGYFGKSIYKKK